MIGRSELKPSRNDGMPHDRFRSCATTIHFVPQLNHDSGEIVRVMGNFMITCKFKPYALALIFFGLSVYDPYDATTPFTEHIIVAE